MLVARRRLNIAARGVLNIAARDESRCHAQSTATFPAVKGVDSSGAQLHLFYEVRMSKKRELIPFTPCIRRSASGSNLLDGAGFSVDPLHRSAVMEWSVRFSAAQTTQSSRWMDFFTAQELLHPDIARERM